MWKYIPGYEGLYKINEYGDVINAKTGKPKLPFIGKNGYKIIELWKNNIPKKFSVHRLVAMTFIPNPNNLPIVMHKDNNKLNTYVGNLKWGTESENSLQAYNDGLNIVPSRKYSYKYFELYSEIDHVICFGYAGVLKTIGYGTNATIHNAISQHSKLRYGPYKGYRIRQLENFPDYQPISFY